MDRTIRPLLAADTADTADTAGGVGRGLGALTPREREVLYLTASGLNRDQVARRLFTSRHTVRTHLYNAFRKLGVRSSAEAVAMLLRADPPGPEEAARAASRLATLSRRERQVLDVLIDTGDRRLAADRLGISLPTLRGHLAQVFAKLDVRSTHAAVAVAVSASAGGR